MEINMKNEVGTKLTLDDGSGYTVVDSFIINNKEYLYLINDSDDKDVSLVSIKDDVIHAIEDDKEFDMALAELAKRHKDEISDILNEADEN